MQTAIVGSPYPDIMRSNPSTFMGDALSTLTVRLVDNGYIVSYNVLVDTGNGKQIKRKELVCKTMDEVMTEIAEFELNRTMRGNVG